jgi:3-methyladenine DNA glycosylase AlkD
MPRTSDSSPLAKQKSKNVAAIDSLTSIRQQVRQQASDAKAVILQRFFKTDPGEYGAGDVFLGVQMPQLRLLAVQFATASQATILKLLQSPYHEERMLALLIFINQYNKGDARARQEIYEAYLGHTKFINNWDLVDVTAPHIVGRHLADKSRRILYSLATSDSLWERRIAILSTFHFIRNNDFADALKLSRLLLGDAHDLIHKAVGWMLREIGNRDRTAEELFLKEHSQKMPRTMLRYAIEKFPNAEREKYLSR